jgi:hypothetical protein
MGVKQKETTYSLSFLQALNNWQRGGSTKQKRKRGLALEKEASTLPQHFKSCNLRCFRQISLETEWIWKLADTLELSETISSWTTSLNVAQLFKGGVPPKEYQGLIFVICPPPSSVILNIEELYKDQNFNNAIVENKKFITNFDQGIGRYWDSQKEVVLKIEKIELDQVYSLGGYSSSREELVKMVYGERPTQLNFAHFDVLMHQNNLNVGPNWLSYIGTKKVIKRVRSHMPWLRTIKELKIN